MTQTGQMPGDDSNSGLTAPGLVKTTTFKVGKGTLYMGKILYYSAHSLQTEKRFLILAAIHWFSK
jgi:hypothetical protein